MANVNRVNGFTPVAYFGGGSYAGNVMEFFHVAGVGNQFLGDLVTSHTTGHTDGTPGCTLSTAGANAIIGAIAGFKVQPANLDVIYIASADTGSVMVACDSTIIYEAQIDEAFAVANIFQNSNLVQTASGNTTTGASGQQIDATYNATATTQLKIIGLVRREDNTVNSLYNRGLVVINNRVFGGGTGTAGI